MRKNGRYTLIEMVIAVGIFGMVMLCAAMGLAAIQKTWSSITVQNQRMRSCQLIDTVVDSSFRNAVPFTWSDSNRKSRTVFLGESGRIIVAYQHRINDVSEGGIRFLSLFVDNGMLVAEYRKTPMLPWEKGKASSETFSEILAERIKSVSFMYAGRRKQDIYWTSAWEPDENNNNIPLAVQIRVEWSNGDSEVWMRRTAGAGLRESYGVRTDKE